MYINTYQLLPLARLPEVFRDWYGQTPSQAVILQATPAGIQKRCKTWDYCLSCMLAGLPIFDLPTVPMRCVRRIFYASYASSLSNMTKFGRRTWPNFYEMSNMRLPPAHLSKIVYPQTVSRITRNGIRPFWFRSSSPIRPQKTHLLENWGDLNNLCPRTY